MSDLRLNLDTIDFERLVELGRSQIPPLARGWTDHNIHDPGIMLMELVAWVADAQVYSLATTRRDERRAYARLLGIEAQGPVPARGLIWPAETAIGERLPWPAGTVLAAQTPVTADRAEAPTFFTTHRIELTTARLVAVVTRFADQSSRDWTRANAQHGATFLPFGEQPQEGDRLLLEFSGGPLLQAKDSDALLSIGFEIEADGAGAIAGDVQSPDRDHCQPIRLRVALSDATADWPIQIALDTTRGLSRSGVLLLKVTEEAARQIENFTISLASEYGTFLRTPRVRRIGVNVLPVEQVEDIVEEQTSFGQDAPDQIYELRHDGLRTGRDALVHPLDDKWFEIALSEVGGFPVWQRKATLDSAGPDDPAYSADIATRSVLFGNGINGRRPAAGATLRAKYRISAGARGNLPQQVNWTVRGVAGIFGQNSEATFAGRDSVDLAQQQSLARRRVRDARPLVTATDLETAARSFTDLGVSRAQELVAAPQSRRVRGTRILVVVGPHGDEPGDAEFEESTVWLAEIRRRLAPLLPLGQRLDVIAPRYVDVRVTAHVVAAPQVDPEVVAERIEEVLREKLALVDKPDKPAWPFGRDVTVLAVKGWLRKVEGVARVVDVSLHAGTAQEPTEHIALGAIGLPRLAGKRQAITVDRFPLGGRP